MALAKPPPRVPGAGVLAKNRDGLIAEKPLYSKTDKIQNRKIMPILIAIIDKVRPMAFARLRWLNRPRSTPFDMVEPDLD
jgi:hypothetical protein